MRSNITWLGLANLLFFPLIFLYQVLFSFFSYADIIRRDPGVLGARKYSNYGRLRLRHYNELDHELNLRLNRSYDFATKLVFTNQNSYFNKKTLGIWISLFRLQWKSLPKQLPLLVAQFLPFCLY